ncbi:MAG: hypothetical protein V1707_00490 [bacterium]
MDKSLNQNRIFELGKIYLQWLNTWNFVSDKWVMTGLSETKRLLGLLAHKCPLCQMNTHYYMILCQAKDADGNPIGKQQILPHYTKSGFFPGMIEPLGKLNFGICPTGHETAKIYVNCNGGDGSWGDLVHQFNGNEISQIARP